MKFEATIWTYCDIWTVSRKRIGKHVVAQRLFLVNQLVTECVFRGYENWKLWIRGNQTVAMKWTHVSMEMWIPGDRLGTERVLHGYRRRTDLIPCGSGSIISTVALPDVGDDRKGNPEYATVKYGHESHGTRIRERLHWRRPAARTKDRPVLSSKRAPHINKPATVWQ
jgi:hypothetical protein